LETIIKAGANSIIINCSETINLFLHTLNIYGLLGYHGQDYPLRGNAKAIAALDPELLERIKDGDRYFSRGDLKIYETGMNYILDNRAWERQPQKGDISYGIVEADFGWAFDKGWDEFYRDYWQETLGERKALFEKCVASFDFIKALEKMTKATHNIFSSNFYIFPAEPLGHSGLKYRDNVCMGGMFPGDDMGFVHEGLHLLLNKRWALDERIRLLMRNYNDDGFYDSWASKYEQALVVGLDCQIKEYDDKFAEKYYNNCSVGDLYSEAYPRIMRYYKDGCTDSVDNLMFSIMSAVLNKNSILNN
jgi:hypothetical protein